VDGRGQLLLDPRAQVLRIADRDRRDGFSAVLFGSHGPLYRHPVPALVDALRRMPSVSSVQITFHEDREPDRHAMPPGGVRLPIVAGTLPPALRRERLRVHFATEVGTAA
jgi:hypothetical protein